MGPPAMQMRAARSSVRAVEARLMMPSGVLISWATPATSWASMRYRPAWSWTWRCVLLDRLDEEPLLGAAQLGADAGEEAGHGLGHAPAM